MTVTIHPVSMIREKVNGYLLLTNKYPICRFVFKYLETKDRFHRQCTMTLEILNEEIRSRDSNVKKLRTAIKNRNENFPFSQVITKELLPIKNVIERLNETAAVLKQEKEHLSDTIIEEYDLNRNNLKAFFESNQDVTQSLYQVNKDILPRLQKYINGEIIKPKERRKLELVLMRIATRGVTKTSPLARFNKVSFNKNHVATDGESTAFYSVNKPQITINNVFLHRIFEAFSLATLKYTPFIINENYYVENGDILVFTQQSDNNKVYNTSDKITKIKASNIIVDILRKYDKQVISFEKLINEYQIPEEKIIKLLNNLFKTGLLKLKNYLSEHGEPIKVIINHIQSYQGKIDDRWIAVAGLLKEIEHNLYHVNVDRNSDIIDYIYQLAFKISQLTGIKPVQEQLIYEDHVIESSKTNNIVSKENLESMEKLIKLFTIFDVNTRIQLELSETLLNEYGSTNINVSDRKLFQHIGNVNMKYSAYWRAPWKEIESQNDRVQTLNKLKNAFITLLTEQQLKGEEIIIREEDLERLYEDIPDPLQSKESSYSFFYQKEQDSIIINKIYPGYMSFYHRFVRYTDIMDHYKNEIKAFYNDDRMIEINEGFGFNANVYTPFMDYRLKSSLTRDHEIDSYYKKVYELNDMVLSWKDPDFYLEDKHGRPFKPIISSSLIRILFPGIIAFYSALFSNISHISELSAIFLQDISKKDVIPIPAVRLGSIVLDRKKWLVKSETFPEHSNDDLIDSVIHLIEFIKKHQLPEKFFIQKRKSPYEENFVDNISMEFDKPQFIDLNNIILVKILFNFAKTSKWLLISEVLPFKVGSPEYMTEFNYSAGKKEVFRQ
ncbi:Lantibiotic dehydratase, C terminus [Gracilibacillus orientalis]|uniref:Lantibiotic dehydratase, C terminus n=2 Tax=Gracilibacillus orientalis TaxID=334253 RepID=A0A1I4J7W4_9BACI|nr:Lantibiotic dehydratase, C terminus [Gracilibacillus orientalis]